MAKADPLPSADAVHLWANLIVGFYLPRRWVRALSRARREALVRYVGCVWAKANDNIVRRIERPRWLPKKYEWGN